MKIALIAPPWYPIPPIGYGGIEIVVADLAKGYQASGNDVVLIAPGDSKVEVPMLPIVERHVGLELGETERDALTEELTKKQFRLALEAGAEIVHDHTDWPHPGDYSIPVVRTVHGPNVERAVRLYAELTKAGDCFVGISERQRELFRDAATRLLGSADAIRFAGVVHNPIDVASVPFESRKQPYAFFLGRCDWEKNPEASIRVARAAGMKLKMALRVNSYERPYFEENVEPLLGPDIELLAEISPSEKYELLAGAQVVLFTSQWEEPFGLVMTEGAACGTPVVAFSRGAAPEIIVDGLTGFLVETEDEMTAAVGRVGSIDPYACRRHMEAHFSPEVSASKYVHIFSDILAQRAASGQTGNEPSANERSG
ncbi:MAG TPA: glycosyltransferase family 4 protein [Dehalococcoidia bacterium]|nr:glycosyltransferase family 4 protein [Dehalococcoidia bacterium]